MDKQHIIDKIKRTAENNGGQPLGQDRFFSETGIRKSDWYGKHWARWGDALIEAGYDPNKFIGAYENDWVIERFISLIRELGRYPVSGELRIKAKLDKGFPAHNVFERLGKKSELAYNILEYCRKREGFDDIVKICEPIANAAKADSSVSTKEHIEIGYVYLMKSGHNYKIGRTNALGRREYELGIQLPEKIVTVHTINTDDPAGIEAYWHKRFEDRRKNGEWFELTADDVKAFKRRKFM
ncbi:MAG: GIY-YIG nuclease family protein [Nitrospirae bacterium]|nr:GIY-YIG nuclease family protein [Nitrospirota bacterium]